MSAVFSPVPCGAAAGASSPPSRSIWDGAAVALAGIAVAVAGIVVAPAAALLAALPLLAGAAGEDSLMLPKDAAMLALTLTSDNFLGPLLSGTAGEGLERAWGAFAGMESWLGDSGAGVSFFRASILALVAWTASSEGKQASSRQYPAFCLQADCWCLIAHTMAKVCCTTNLAACITHCFYAIALLLKTCG